MYFLDAPSTNRFWQPAADVHETENAITIKLEVAGVTVADVQVSLSGDGRRLVVAGVRRESEEERQTRTACHQLEIYFGPFERTFLLPPEMPIDRDEISATLKDGFLTIILPRRISPPAVTRNIPIEVAED
ncbi:MAG: hypothetical protein OHK0029_13970 [Armatimonadaceae bacterium]